MFLEVIEDAALVITFSCVSSGEKKEKTLSRTPYSLNVMTSMTARSRKMASSESSRRQRLEERIHSLHPLLSCLSPSLKAMRGGVAQLISSSSSAQFVFPLHFYPDFEDNRNHLLDPAFIYLWFLVLKSNYASVPLVSFKKM